VRIAVTGRPGIGKTTLCLKVYNSLKDVMDISGFVTFEVRRGGTRIGFKLRDLKSNKELWLARVGSGRVKVGKYAVFVESIDQFARLIRDYKSSEFVIIDEIGPMELKSDYFVSEVQDLMKRDNLLFTIHYKAKHPLLERIRNEFELYVLNEQNRDRIAEEIIGRIIDDYKRRKG